MNFIATTAYFLVKNKKLVEISLQHIFLLLVYRTTANKKDIFIQREFIHEASVVLVGSV